MLLMIEVPLKGVCSKIQGTSVCCRVRGTPPGERSKPQQTIIVNTTAAVHANPMKLGLHVQRYLAHKKTLPLL